jgi:large repetitive protein
MSEALFVPRRWRRVAPVVMSSLILIGAGTQLPALSVFAVDAPVPTAVRCGQVLDTSVLVTNDLSDCPADGLIIGAPGITVALDGHTIDGVGLGTGVLNDGHRGVTITGGTLREFDVGVLLNPGTADNVASHLDVELNQEAGIRLSGAHSGNLIHSNTFVGNALAVGLVDGTEGAIVRDNAVPDGSGHGLEIIASHGNRLEGNAVTGGSDAGIVLEGSRRNVLVGNQVSGVSDAAVLVHTESDGNRIEGNTVTASDGGVVVGESSGNLVIGNAIHDMSDSGVDLDAAHRTVVLDNDLRFNGEGIEVFDSTGNRLESNDTSRSTGTAISIEGASTGNAVLRNIADDNGSNGIAVIALATPGEGNVLSGNRASRNQGAGISVSSAGHSIGSNVADDNGGWGIYAVSGNLDAGGNMASGNREPSQCSGVVCNGVSPVPDVDPPGTEITDRPLNPSAVRYATFAFTTDDEDVATRFECSLDDAPFEPCTSPSEYSGLDLGWHTFAVRSIDVAGNVDPTPAAYIWVIEAAPPVDCGSTVVATADADAWIDQNSSTANKGDDSALKVRSKGPSDNFRTLVRLPLPAMPDGCAVDTATLSLYSSGAAASRTLHALSIAAAWSENTVTWSNQPRTTGLPAATPAGEGFRHWNVKAQVQEMYDTGVSHGFLIRDATEGADAEQSFSTRDDEEGAPRLALRFMPVLPTDTTPPDTSIGTGPEASTTATTAGFTFTADEDAATFGCALDGQDYTECTSPATYTGLSQGTHLFSVRATDPAGNTDPTPATWAWTITTPEPEPDCGAPATALTSADAWLDENSATTNKGDDAILKVQSKGPRDNFRALVRFALPPLPPGCAIESATLRLYAASSTPGRSIEVVRITGTWTETGVSWANQPTTTGPAATTPSAAGYREWTVATQVQAMYDSGINQGFLIRDAAEGADAEQQFHGREKGENPPQLALRFARR